MLTQCDTGELYLLLLFSLSCILYCKLNYSVQLQAKVNFWAASRACSAYAALSGTRCTRSVSVCVCVRACVRACARARVRVCVVHTRN